MIVFDHLIALVAETVRQIQRKLVQTLSEIVTRSDRLRAMDVFLYMFGLSYRATATFVRSLQWKASKSAIERAVAEAGQHAKTLHSEAPPVHVRVLGVNGTGAEMAGMDAGMLFFVDVPRALFIASPGSFLSNIGRNRGGFQEKEDTVAVVVASLYVTRHTVLLAFQNSLSMHYAR
jgi:hypothetical protein